VETIAIQPRDLHYFSNSREVLSSGCVLSFCCVLQRENENVRFLPTLKKRGQNRRFSETPPANKIAEDHDAVDAAVRPSSVALNNADASDTSSSLRLAIDGLIRPALPDSPIESGSATIRLVDSASGRNKSVEVKAGARLAGKNEEDSCYYSVADIPSLIISSSSSLVTTNRRDFASWLLSDSLQSESDPRLCEAVLRSVFAPRAPGESMEDCVKNAEIVKRAFTLHDTVYSKAESRALKVAQYRRARTYAFCTTTLDCLLLQKMRNSSSVKRNTPAPKPQLYIGFLLASVCRGSDEVGSFAKG